MKKKNLVGVVALLALAASASAFAQTCDEADLKSRVADYVTRSMDPSGGETLVQGTLKISSDAEQSHTSTNPEQDDVQTIMHASFDTTTADGTRQSAVAVVVFSHGSPLGAPRCKLINSKSGISGVELYR